MTKRLICKSSSLIRYGVAVDVDESIWTYIFEGVTCGVSFGVLVTKGIPCSKDYYYDRYRKFFWLLDKAR